LGQKTHPIGFRLGVIHNWDSNWYDDKSFAAKLMEDSMIRSYVKKRHENAGISRIEIERTIKKITLIIHTSRPGYVIGRSGKDITQLEAELKKLTNKEVKVLVTEIKKPELDAYLVAETIANQISNRVSYRRAIKAAMASTVRMGGEGIKIYVGGRLNGAEIARSEQFKDGRIPLHTLRANIDYAGIAAPTIYGMIGVKVWICVGEKIIKQK
jgi:small subunit ribosomal protein S3